MRYIPREHGGNKIDSLRHQSTVKSSSEVTLLRQIQVGVSATGPCHHQSLSEWEEVVTNNIFIYCVENEPLSIVRGVIWHEKFVCNLVTIRGTYVTVPEGVLIKLKGVYSNACQPSLMDRHGTVHQFSLLSHRYKHPQGYCLPPPSDAGADKG